MHMKNSISDSVREFVCREYLVPARRRGDSRVRIVAGDVHRAMRFNNRVPLVCNALASREFLEANHLRLESREGPPSGMSTTVVFNYRLADDSSTKTEGLSEALDRFRGAGRDLFAALGGGEAFLRAEREGWEESTP
jgi:hypothetical protein